VGPLGIFGKDDFRAFIASESAGLSRHWHGRLDCRRSRFDLRNPRVHPTKLLLLADDSGCIVISVTEGMSMSRPSDLVQGTLDMLLLKILTLSPMNGFAVSQRLKQVSGDVLQMSDGSLYPALHKLEQEGWITAEWKTSVNGRRAKYYSLTRLGRRQLERETDNWGRLSGAISRVVKLKEA
jgi:PadR family transcriptional regulator PadR